MECSLSWTSIGAKIQSILNFIKYIYIYLCEYTIEYSTLHLTLPLLTNFIVLYKENIVGCETIGSLKYTFELSDSQYKAEPAWFIICII